jgi:hypothetical protein
LLLLAVLALPATFARGEEPIGDTSAGEPRYIPFTVMTRQDKLFFFPCGDCHEFLDPNPEIRELDPDPDHPAILDHGNGEVWCTSCHSQSPYETLHTLLGEPVGYDESHRVCGGCHSHKLRDWRYGAHGKRVANWQGERQLYGCPECHNPHAPAIAPRPPLAPPPVRARLERIDGHSERQPPRWEMQAGDSGDE